MHVLTRGAGIIPGLDMQDCLLKNHADDMKHACMELLLTDFGHDRLTAPNIYKRNTAQMEREKV